jgi:hypothetical protein
MNLPRPLPVALLLWLGLAACTSQTSDNFESPPPGPPATCTADAAVAGCAGGSVGYTCTRDRPDDGDTNLVCSDGTPGAAGLTIYCCAPYGQYWSSCTVDTGVAGCVGNAFGFTCSGAESPGEADASLTCSAGTASGSDTLYCCNSVVLPPTCAADPTVQGCEGASIGYSCTVGATPADGDSGFVCTPGASGGFCCTLGPWSSR